MSRLYERQARPDSFAPDSQTRARLRSIRRSHRGNYTGEVPAQFDHAYTSVYQMEVMRDALPRCLDALRRGADPAARSMRGSVLHTIVRCASSLHRPEDSLLEALELRVRVDLRDAHSDTALHLAAQRGCASLTWLLLEAGADV